MSDEQTQIKEPRNLATEPRAGAPAARIDVRTMTYIAVSVALAAVLNFIPLFKMPQGGSISLDMLPIIFLAFYLGVRPAVIAGAIFGFVDYAFAPFFVHPAQLILDYPLAFGLLGLAGVVKGRGPVSIAVGAMLGGLLRFASHLVSGAIFFADYAPEGQNPWVYSAIYNGSYMLPSIILVSLLVYTLLKVMNSTEGPRTN